MYSLHVARVSVFTARSADPHRMKRVAALGREASDRARVLRNRWWGAVGEAPMPACMRRGGRAAGRSCPRPVASLRSPRLVASFPPPVERVCVGTPFRHRLKSVKHSISTI